ncbi:hypothetical protein AAC387_Pa05g1484 [Persea americana]
MVEAIRSKLMEFFELYQQKSYVPNSKLTRYAESMLRKESEHALRLGVRAASLTEIEVHSTALKMRGDDPCDNCEQWLTSDMYRRTYNFVIHGTKDMNQWDVRTGSHVLPPNGKRQAGRPKKNRIRTKDHGRNKVTCS